MPVPHLSFDKDVYVLLDSGQQPKDLMSVFVCFLLRYVRVFVLRACMCAHVHVHVHVRMCQDTSPKIGTLRPA